MKTKLTKLFTALAMAFGLASAASAANRTDWTLFCTEETYKAESSAGNAQYDKSQNWFIFRAKLTSECMNGARLVKYGSSNSNYISVKTTADGKYRLEIWRNGKTTLTKDSTVAVTAGSHTFAMLVRRGSSDVSQLISVILYMDGAEISKIVHGQDGVADGETFAGNPMANFTIGEDGKNNRITLYRTANVGSDTLPTQTDGYTTDTATMANIMADANEYFPPLVALFYGSTLVDGATYTGAGGVQYTLNANGNTAITGGGIQISTGKGVSVTPASGSIGNQATTVIVKYTGYDTSSLGTDDAKALIINHTANTSYKDMLGMAATSGGNVWGVWQNGKWGTNKTTSGKYGSSATDTKQFAMTWSQTETAAGGSSHKIGTWFCMDGGTIEGWGSLHGSLDVDGIWVGGPNESETVGAATGMKITAIAVFAGRITDAEIQNFVFPTEGRPVAKWTDFHNLSSGGYTWTNVGGTVNDDGSLTVGENGGLVLTVPTTIGKGIYTNRRMAMVLDVEVPADFDSERAICDILVNGSHVNLTSSGTTIYQRWNNDTKDYGNCTWTPNVRRKIAITFNGYSSGNTDRGTYTHFDGVNKMANTGLITTAGNITKLAVGHYVGDTATKIANGMKVYGIELYDTNMTAYRPEICWNFDGNFTGTGITKPAVSGESTSNFVDSFGGQAMKVVSGSTHPYGSSWTYGSGSWTATTVAQPVANASSKIVLWTSGVNGGWAGLLSDSANKKIIFAYGNSSTCTEICSATLPADFNAAYHLYTVRYDGNGYYEIFVDKNFAGAGTGTYTTSLPTGSYQIGAVNGGCPSGLARTTGTLIDDLRIYTYGLTDSEVATVYNEFHNCYEATMTGNSSFSELDWTPAKPADGFEADAVLTIKNTAAATLTLDENVSVATILAESAAGNALTLKYTHKTIDAACDFSGALGGVTIDASGIPSGNIARYAVKGAPYSYWLAYGENVGAPTVTGVPTAPTGYTFTQETVEGHGIRVVATTTLTDAINTGSVSVNISNGTDIGTGTHGLYPVYKVDWKELTKSKLTDTFSGATFTLSGKTGTFYGCGGTQDLIQKDYVDDGNEQSITLTIQNVPYEKYRIITYLNSDSGDVPFVPVKINGTYYAGLTTDGTASTTVKGRSANWGKSNSRGTMAEGINVVVSDVLTEDTAVVDLYTVARGTARGAPAAYQLIEVGVVAKIGDVPYSSVTEAIEAATSGDTITLARDWYEPVIVSKSVTFDPNDKTFTGSFAIDKDCELTLTGNNVTLSGVTGEGTLKVADGITVTANNGSDGYAVNGATVSIDNGTFKLYYGNADAKVNGATFILGENGNLDNQGWPTLSGTVTLDSNYNKDVLNNSGGNQSSIRGDGTIVKTGTGTITIKSLLQASDDTSHKHPVTVSAGTLMLTHGTYPLGALSGSGILGYNGGNATAFPGAPESTTGWTGTVWFKSYEFKPCNGFANFANANSKIKLTSCKGYAPNSNLSNENLEFVLEDDGDTAAWDINNGYGGGSYHFQMGKLTGTGTFKGSNNPAQNYAVKDGSEFAGTINLGNKGVIFTFGTSVLSKASGSGGYIRVDSGYTANVAAGKTWTATGGFDVNGTIGGAGTLSGNVTFGNGATIDVSGGNVLTATGTLTFNATSTKVRVAAAPTLETPVKILSKGSAGQSVINTSLEVYVGDAKQDGTFKLVYKDDGVYAVLSQTFTATKSASTSWSDIDWTGTGTPTFYDAYALTVSGENLTLTFTSWVKSQASLTITGGSVTMLAADSLYVDGCWEDAVSFASVTGTFDVPSAVKTGFYGAYTKTDTGFKLRAQNKEVISINICGGRDGGTTTTDSPEANFVKGDGFYGIAPTLGSSWNNINGNFNAGDGNTRTLTIEAPNAYDGAQTINRPSMSLSAAGKNTWQAGDLTNPFLRGYLDDGMGVTVLVHGIPYTAYDVIVYATSDSSTIDLAPITINGTQYTFADGVTKAGSTCWGQGLYDTPEIGKNALRVNNCSGEELTISATRVGNSGRATLCAVQVICKGTVAVSSKYYGNVTGTATWTDGEDDENIEKLGQGWANSQLSTLTLTNKANATLTFSPAENLTGMSFKVVSAADYKLTIPATSLEKLSFGTIDFSEALGGVEVDLNGVAATEKTLLAGTLSGAENISYANGNGCGIFADSTGIHQVLTTTGKYANPVTGDEADFTKVFFGSSDGAWQNQANWRTLTTSGSDKLWAPYTSLGNAKSPAMSNHSSKDSCWRVVLDGTRAVNKDVTCNENLDGWHVEYALFNGIHATVSLGKLQRNDTTVGFFWVDATSSLTLTSVSGTRNLPMNFAVAAANGLVFKSAWDADVPFNYYLKGAGTVNFEAGASAGTHTIKQIEVNVGDTTKAAKHVGKQLLISLGAASSATFSAASDITATCSDTSLNPVYQAEMPTAANEYGTYTIRKEDDGVYAYVVQHSDTWDIVEPLSATLTDDEDISDMDEWTDGLGHAQTGAVSSEHQYKFIGAHTLTIDQVMFEDFNVTLDQTTLATGDYVLTNATVAGKGTVTGTLRGGTLKPETDGALAIDAMLADNQNITVNGAGKATLNSANASYTGTVTVSGGTFALGADASIGTGTVTTAKDAVFELADGQSVSAITGSGIVRKVGTGETTIAAGVIPRQTQDAQPLQAIVVTEGTLKLGNSGTFYKDGANRVGTPLTVTGGTLDLNDAYTWATDGSGILGAKPFTLGGATATEITGGNFTFYGSVSGDSIVYDGGSGANAPATISANWHGSYSHGTYSRYVNVGRGNGADYDLLFSGTIGVSGAQYGGTTIYKTGAGTLYMTGAYNFPGLTIEAGTWKIGSTNAIAAATTVGENGTLDLNGFSFTNLSITCSGTITNTSDTAVEIVSAGTTVDLTGATIDGNIALKALWADMAPGTQPFIISDYTKVTFIGEQPSYLNYDTTTGKIVFSADSKLGDDFVWLPVGDSITEGESKMGDPTETDVDKRGGYRYQLWNYMEQGGQQTRSVGYRTGHCGTVEDPLTTRWAWHAAQYGGVIMHDSNGGHGATGMNVENILEVAGYPDVVTVLIGVNDLSFSGDTAKVFETWKRMIVKYANQRPNSKIVASTLLPAGGNRMTYIAPFNALVREAAEDGTAPFDEPNVVFADIAKIAFNDAVDSGNYKSDVLHPNETGAKIVGQAFVKALGPVLQGIAQAQAVPVSIHNGKGDKVSVRFSKKIGTMTAATLTITGKDVDGNEKNWVFNTPAISSDDARVVEFDVGSETLVGGAYTATLTGVEATDGNGIALDATPVMTGAHVEILGTGAEKNIPSAYRQNFTKMQTVEIENGTIADGIGAGVNYGGDGPSAAWTELAAERISRVGYYVELQRTNEPAQFVWVSMNADAFNFTTNAIGVPTTVGGNVKATVSHFQVYGNRGNFTNVEATDATQTGVIEFSPWTATSADESTFPADFKSNKFGWNDTLGTSTLKGCMQVARCTGVTTTDDYTELAGEMVFAFNNFNGDTATDIGIGTFSTHRNNAGSSPDIAPVIDWTDFVSNSKFTKFAVNAYKVKKIEIWAAPLMEYEATLTESKPLSETTWTLKGTETQVSGANLPAGAELSLDVSGDVTLTVDVALDASELIVTNTENDASFTIATTYNGTVFVGTYDVAATLDAFETDLAWNQDVTIPACKTFALNVKEGADYTMSHVISGAGKFVKKGAGVLGLMANNTYTGGTEVQGGGIKFAAYSNATTQGPIGPYYSDTTTWTTNATVFSGAFIDVNGKQDMTYVIELQDGATFKNSSATGIGDNNRQTKRISLSGDATVDATGSFGIHNGGHNTCHLDLGTYTLTKVGTGIFDLVNATVNGTGTILVNAGTLRVGVSGDVTATDATISVGNSGTLQVDSDRTLTVKALTNAGTISNSGTILGLTTLNGTVDMTAGGTWGFGDALTIASGTTTMGATQVSALGSKPVTLAGGTLSVTEDATLASPITATAASTITVAEGKTLKISGNVTGGENITVAGAGRVIFTSYRGGVTVAEGGKVGYMVNINDCGEFTIPSGMTDSQIELYKADGTKITTTTEGGKLIYTWELTDSVCWWDYEFNGSLANTGTDTTQIGKELTDPYYNAASNALRVGYATPWTDVSAYPQEFTALFYGKLVDNENHVEMAFGSTTGGTKVNVAITCGNPVNEEVRITIAAEFDTKKTVTMNVPNAYSADHLYAFVAKTIDDGGTEKTKILVYLDGVEWDSYTFDEKVTLGSGFQIGSVHGSVPSGCIKANTSDKNADLDWLRVYNVVLTQDAMTKYADKYPYTSKNGTSERAFTGNSSWDVGEESEPWTVTLFDKSQYTTNVALAGSVVKVEADTAASEITMNLTEATSYEAMRLSGDYAITLKAGDNAVRPSVVGLTTIATDVTNAYDAINFGKVEVQTGNKLVYDFTTFPFNTYFASATIEFTGAVSGEGTVEAVGLPTTGARTAQFVKNASNHYELQITVVPQPFIYTIGATGPGVWTWDGQEVSAELVEAQTSGAIEKMGDGVAALEPKANFTYDIKEGTLKFTKAVLSDCQITNVAAGAAFDVNGLESGDADHAIGFVVTLNGGSITNSSSAKGILKGLTLVADSSIAAGTNTVWMQSGSAGYSGITLALGDHTLTKTGTGQFGVVTTTVMGTGTIDVQAGELWVRESSDFGSATVKVGVNGTFHVRGGKTATVAKITGEGGTLNVDIEGTNKGNFTDFNLTGTIELAGTGGYGTITMEEDAVAVIGKRGLTFAGAGTVNVNLTQAEINAGTAENVYSLADGATTAMGVIKDVAGNDVTELVTVTERTITIPRAAVVNDTDSYVTFAAAIAAANELENANVLLLTNATVTADMEINSDVKISCGKKTLDFGTVRGKTLKALAGYGTVTATITADEVTAGEDLTLFTLTDKSLSDGIQIVAKCGETAYPTYFDPSTGTLTITPAAAPTPYSWYEFNGNATAHADTTGIFSGDYANLVYHASPHGQMMETTSSASPYFNDRNTGSTAVEEWTVITFARAVNSEHKMIWAFGTASDGGVGLASDGADGIRAGRFNSNGILTGDDQFVRVQNINSSSRFHCYALVRTGSGNTARVTFYIDGVAKGSFCCPNNNVKGQIGGVHTGSQLMRADGTRVDDWRYYRSAVKPAFIKQIADEFTVWPTYKGPLTYTIAENKDLSDTTWTDADSTEVSGAYWPNLAGYSAKLTVGADATTLTADVSMASDTLTVTNAYAFTLKAASGKTIAGSVVDTDSTGATTLDFAPVNVTAGANTIVKSAGTGTLTIAANKKATIPGWTDAATKITGAGELVVDTGAKETEFQVASFAFTGKFTLARGTWNANTAFPTGRELYFDGENTVLLLNKADVTAYSSGLPKLHFDNGATMKVTVRDTFSRELVLGENAYVELFEPSSGRSLDFFSNSKLTAYGSCAIGGTTKQSISGSGLISIRRDDFVMWVAENKTLSVYAQWGYNCEANSITRACKKSGPGTAAFYRAPGQTGKFTVEQGTLKLVDAGAPTTGEIALSDGTTLELNTATAQTIANVITGAGVVKKTGSGTTTLTGVNTFTGGVVIEAGILAATTNTLGSGTITVKEGAYFQIDMDDYAQVLQTTDKVFNFADEASAGRLNILNGDKYPHLRIGTTGDEIGKIIVDETKQTVKGLHISQMCPKPSYGVRDPNGRESGWVDLFNYGPEDVDLAHYKLCRANMGKKFKTDVENLLAKTVKKGETFRVYMSEDYPTAEDYDKKGTKVRCFKTEGNDVVEYETWQDGGAMVVPTKVNPKKVPLVRLYQYGNGATNVVDEVVVPCDIDDDAIVGLEAVTNKVACYVIQDNIRTDYGPEVMGLYGLTKKDLVVTDIQFMNKHDGFIPTTADFEIAMPVNPFRKGDTTLDKNEITGVKLVYRIFKVEGTMDEVEIEMAKGKEDKNYGQYWTNAIPASVLAENPGALVQYRAKITDADGKEWTAPRFLNKDIGYEWYGAVIQPAVAATVADAGVCTNKLQTFLLFADNVSTNQMDKDILNQDRTKVPYGARVQVYDTQTHTYYDNVRIDLRGQTSASFKKVSHGLRFGKTAPLNCVNPFEKVWDKDANEGEGAWVDKPIEELRKTSFCAEYGDPSLLRQALSCRLLADAGVKVPFSYPVRLYLNGAFYQLAFHSNRFTDELVEDYYGLNKFGYAYKNVGTYAPDNKGPSDGKGTEKKTPDDDNEADMTVLNQYTARFSAAKFDEGKSLSDATKTALTKVAMTNFNLAAWANYLAAVRITQENDDVWTNIGGYINKYDAWYNQAGDDTLMPLAYDLNLSWGQWYYGDDSVSPKPGVRATNDWFKCHPFYGGWQVRCHKTDGTAMANANYAYETFYQNATYREMFLRRIRTLMDKYLKEPGTPKDETPVWDWVVAYTNAIAGDVATDRTKWDYTNMGKDQAHASQIWVWSNVPSFEDAVEEIWTNYIVPRREHLYCTHSTTNSEKAVGYDKDLSAGIPFAQAATETFGKHGALYFTDVNGKKPGEDGYNLNVADGIIGICNTNAVAIDVSDWTVEGAVVATFAPGTVIPSNGVLWVVADRRKASPILAEAEGGTANPVIVNGVDKFDTTSPELHLKDADGTEAISYEAQIGTKYYITFADALRGAAADAVVTLLTDVNNASAQAVNTSVYLYGDTNTLTGAGFDVADGNVLTIASGRIANGALAGATVGKVVLIGGKYVGNDYSTLVSNEYHMAEIGLKEGDYTYQVIPGKASEVTDDEIVLPVAQVKTVSETEAVTNDTGVLAFSTNWLVNAKLATVDDFKTDAGKMKVVDNLNTRQANQIQVWENKVLGLDGTQAAQIPVIQPKQTDDAANITFKLDNVDVDETSGAIVTYRVWSGNAPGVKTESSDTVLHSVDTAMPLPDKGVRYYTIEVITTPAK